MTNTFDTGAKEDKKWMAHSLRGVKNDTSTSFSFLCEPQVLWEHSRKGTKVIKE